VLPDQLTTGWGDNEATIESATTHGGQASHNSRASNDATCASGAMLESRGDAPLAEPRVLRLRP
jgi:hypothetical protein